MDTTLETLHEAEDDLMGRSFLYEHPASFREGVEAWMEAVRAMLANVVGWTGFPATHARTRRPSKGNVNSGDVERGFTEGWNEFLDRLVARIQTRPAT